MGVPTRPPSPRLFECIGVGRRDCCPMRKGSPQDYTAEIGCSKQPIQKSRLGEPHECYSLYRIRRSQENYQFLRKDGRRPDRGGRHTRSGTYGVAPLGGSSETCLAWRDGSDAVQCVDLRHAEALRQATFHGPSGQDEGRFRGQEQERSYRCTHDCRSVAVQSVARLLCITAAAARPATPATLSQPGGTTIGAHAEQDGRPADGERHCIRQAEAAPEEIFRRPDEEPGGSTRI